MSLLVKGVTQFIQLTDVPASYAGQALKPVRVNAGQTALEFAAALTQYTIPSNITPDTLTEMYYNNTMGHIPNRSIVVGKYWLQAGQAAGGNGYIRIFDCTNIKAPVLLSTITGLAGAVLDFAVSGKYIFIVLVVVGVGRMLVYDWSNPASPTQTADVALLAGITDAKRIVVRGRYAYICARVNNAVVIMDVSNPYAPTYVGQYTHATNVHWCWDIVVQGNYAFVYNDGQFADRGWITALSIADPTNPSFISRVQVNAVAAPGANCWMRISGKYLYLTDTQANAVRIVDVSNPAAMTLLWSVVDAVNLEATSDLSVVGDWIFANANKGSGVARKITILDWRVKTAAPVLWQSKDLYAINFGQQGGSLTIAGKYIFVAFSATNADFIGIWACWAFDVPAFIGNSIYAEYIYCDNLDVAALANIMAAQIGGVGIPDMLPRLVQKTADETVNNSNVLQNDDELRLSIAANEVWCVEFFLIVNCPSLNPDWQFAITAPAGATVYAGLQGNYDAAGWGATVVGNAPTDLVGAGVAFACGSSASGNNTGIVIRAIVINGANAGNIQLQWAQNTATVVDSIVRARSHLLARKIR